ncbi:MAG: ABC transporter permease subunit [Dehalococcoidia bacterium]
MTSATITATKFATRGAERPSTFMDALISEWTKLTSLRATYITLGLGVILSIGTTAIAAVGMGASGAEWPEQFDPILFSMVGNVFALITYSVFGVLVVSREYSSGTIRLTLTGTPNRGRVLAAKLLLVSSITLVYGLATTIGMFQVGQALLGAYGYPTSSLAHADARWVVLGLGVTMPFFPILGLAFGFLLRSTAGAITTVLGLLWLPQIFSEVMPVWGREHLISKLPGAGLDSTTIGQMMEAPEYSSFIAGFVIATVWFVAILGAAYFAFTRRDA